MLTQLSTLKSRLSIPDSDTTNDAILTSAIKAVSARFDKETNRTLARTIDAPFEFDPTDTDLSPPCYPIESVTKFEIKSSESDGWQPIDPAPDFLIRRGCILSLTTPIPLRTSHLALRTCYTGGYVLPGTTPQPGQSPLPEDLEQACVEQCAFWFQNRDRLGLKTHWPSGEAYRQFATQDLLGSVQAVLARYRRWSL